MPNVLCVLLHFVCIWIRLSDSQTCTNSHAQDTVISVSVNRAILNIGATNYLDIVGQAVSAILPSVTDVALQTFGGPRTGTGNDVNQILSLSTRSTTNVVSNVTNLGNSVDFSLEYGNAVSDAVDSAVSMLDTLFNLNQKYHIVFAASMPLAAGFDTSTTPDVFNDPCTASRTAKDKDIQQFVALIGRNGVHFVKEYYDCLVEDPDQDIVIIDPSNPSAGISALFGRVCKTNGLDFKITEVNPTTGVYSPFIEVLNRGAPTTLQVCFSGRTCSSSGTVGTGRYFVGYGSGGISPAQGVRMPGLQAAASTNGWTAQALSGNTIVSVTHSSANLFPLAVSDRTFVLRSSGYNSNYGLNWRLSCPVFIDGSPGVSAQGCVQQHNLCAQSKCNLNVNAFQQCTQTGSNTDSICLCSSGVMEDGDTCRVVPTPTQCQVYIIGDSVSNRNFFYFTFDRIPYDGEATFVVSYPKTASFNRAFQAVGLNVAAINDAYVTDDVNITVTSQYVQSFLTTIVSKDVTLSCMLNTMNPSMSPTDDPTTNPTERPTERPTDKPTGEPTNMPTETPVTANPSSVPTKAPVGVMMSTDNIVTSNKASTTNISVLYFVLICFFFLSLMCLN